ncbi:MAG: hypothetical protein V4529_11705 [Gemmatimonadota bacterium]
MYTRCAQRLGPPDAKDIARSIPSSIQHIVVMCDGTPSGDGALRLADAISQGTGASVRAVTWLPDGYALYGEAPIEKFLASVTRQLYRITPMAGFWRLELLAGHVDMRLALLCATESAQLLIVPGALSLASPGYRWTPMAGIPAVCVVQDTEPCGEQAILHARADARSQLDAHVAAAIVTAAHTVHAVAHRSRGEYAKPSCPYVHVQTEPAVASYLVGAHSSSNSLSLTAS